MSNNLSSRPKIEIAVINRTMWNSTVILGASASMIHLKRQPAYTGPPTPETDSAAQQDRPITIVEMSRPSARSRWLAGTLLFARPRLPDILITKNRRQGAAVNQPDVSGHYI